MIHFAPRHKVEALPPLHSKASVANLMNYHHGMDSEVPIRVLNISRKCMTGQEYHPVAMKVLKMPKLVEHATLTRTRQHVPMIVRMVVWMSVGGQPVKIALDRFSLC